MSVLDPMTGAKVGHAADRHEGRLVELFGKSGVWTAVSGAWSWVPEPAEVRAARHELEAAILARAAEWAAAEAATL